MKFTQRQLMMVGGAVVGLLIVGVLIFMNTRSGNEPKPVKLTMWGFEDPKVYVDVLANYKKLKPYVTIEYKELTRSEYSGDILDALASGKGPDIFFIPNYGLKPEINKLSPAPSAQITAAALPNSFPSVVSQDFVSGGRVYALPLYIDTLALIYNRDLFDQAAITAPPQTWEDFQRVIPYLRKVNESGQIEQSAAALGTTSQNIKYSPDILSLLLIQNSGAIIDPKGIVLSNVEKALQAFNFYLQFSNSNSPYYTWTANQPEAMESFSQGKTAMIFGYLSDYFTLKQKNPFLNIGVSGAPQIGSDIKNYAKYWGMAVSTQSKNKTEAWSFIVTAATNSAIANSYMKAASLPPALKTSIGKQINDPVFSIFAKQALTAKSWAYPDENRVRQIYDGAINAVLGGSMDSSRAFGQIKSQISQMGN